MNDSLFEHGAVSESGNNELDTDPGKLFYLSEYPFLTGDVVDYKLDLIQKELSTETNAMLDALDAGVFFIPDGTVEGPLAFFYSDNLVPEFSNVVLEIRKKTKKRLERETDIYDRSAQYGHNVDPLTLNWDRTFLKNGGKVVIESENVVEHMLPGAAGVASNGQATVTEIQSGEALGFQELVTHLLKTHSVPFSFTAIAHEASHVGGQKSNIQPDINILKYMKKNIQRTTPGERGTADWRVFTEVIARIAESDFGYKAPSLLQSIVSELNHEIYGPTRNSYKERGYALDYYAFVEECYNYGYALSGLGLTGFEIEQRLANELSISKSDNGDPSRLLIALEKIKNEEMDKSHIQTSPKKLTKLGFQLAELRHVKFLKIIFEEAEIAGQMVQNSENKDWLIYDFSTDEKISSIITTNIEPGLGQLGIKIVADKEIPSDRQPGCTINVYEYDDHFCRKQQANGNGYSKYSKVELQHLADFFSDVPF